MTNLSTIKKIEKFRDLCQGFEGRSLLWMVSDASKEILELRGNKIF